MSGKKEQDEKTVEAESADVIPFELLKLDRAVAARLEEALDFVPDSKSLVKEAFRRLRSGDRTAFEKIDGEIREHLEAEMLRLIQTDPGLREIVTSALMQEAEATILEDRSVSFEDDLSPGESEAVKAFRASLDGEALDDIYRLMTLGAGASQRGEDRFASSLFNEAIAAAPDYFEAYLLRGVNHARNERFASALKDAETTLTLCPECARAHELKGSALRGLGRDDESMSALTEGVRRLPESSGLRVMRGAAYVRREAFKDAARDLDVAVRNGAGAIGYVLRGEARLGVDAFASAQKDFEAALLVDPYHPRALGGLVQTQARRRNWTDLIETTSRLIDEVGPDPEAFAQRAHARLEKGETFAALLDSLAALSVTDHQMARRWADSAVARLGIEPETTARDLMIALENSELLESHGYSATAFFDQVEKHARSETFAITLARAIRAREVGTHRQVCQLARRAARMPGATSDAAFVLAGASLEAGDFAGAREAAEKIVAAGEDGALSWTVEDAILICAAAIEEEEGGEKAARYLNGAPASYGISREMGRLRAELGDDEGARRALRAAYEAYPRDPGTLFENARFEASRDPDEAIRFLRELVDHAPHYGWAVSGEGAFAPLRHRQDFNEILQGSSTLATSLQIDGDFETVVEHATARGWIWRWVGRKTVGRYRLVAWDLPEKADATAFYFDDAVSGVRAIIFYGEDAGKAAEETRRSLPGTMQWTVGIVSEHPVEAVRELRRAGWAMSQGLMTQRAFDEVVLECLNHQDAYVQWRAAAAASQSDWSEVGAQLREMAYGSDCERVREEALFSLRQSSGEKIPLQHRDRWETFQTDGERDAIERCLWEEGFVFIGENEPDDRSAYEISWASQDGEAVVSYIEDEHHDVKLMAFSGEADAVVRRVAEAVPLRALEDVVSWAFDTRTVQSVRAVGALLPEDRIDVVVELVEELLDAGDSDSGDSDAGDSDAGDSDSGDSDAGDSDSGELRRAVCEFLAARREWLPDPACDPPEPHRVRRILRPTEAPERVAEVAAREGWRWSGAAESPDREHPANHAFWSVGGAKSVELRLHRFGFWFIDLLEPGEALEAVVFDEFEVQEADGLVARTTHPDSSVRADAVHQLGILAAVDPRESYVEAIRRGLDDDSLEVRTHALEAACVGARLTELRDAVERRVEVETDPDIKDYAAVLLETL